MPDIELTKIQPNKLNPRLEFSKTGLDELADSIKQVGILEPIVVRSLEGDKYEIVVGERRYRAAHRAGLARVPAIIRDYSDDEVMEINLIENIQREDLSAVEKGKLCKRLLQDFPEKFPNQSAVAKYLGFKAESISAWIRTTGLPERIQRLIAPEIKHNERTKGKLDYDAALRITRNIKDASKAVERAEKVAKDRVPGREARKIIKEISGHPKKPLSQVFREVIDEAPIFLPFSKVHADSIIENVKTQTTRKSKDPRLQKGVIVRAQITHFADLEVFDIYRKKLADFNEDDAHREGGYTLDEFKEVWKSLHGSWNPNESVYIVRFNLLKTEEGSIDPEH